MVTAFLHEEIVENLHHELAVAQQEGETVRAEQFAAKIVEFENAIKLLERNFNNVVEFLEEELPLLQDEQVATVSLGIPQQVARHGAIVTEYEDAIALLKRS